MTNPPSFSTLVETALHYSKQRKIIFAVNAIPIPAIYAYSHELSVVIPTAWIAHGNAHAAKDTTVKIALTLFRIIAIFVLANQEVNTIEPNS